MHSETHLSFLCDPQASDTLDNVKAKMQHVGIPVSASIVMKQAAQLTPSDRRNMGCCEDDHRGLYVVVQG